MGRYAVLFALVLCFGCETELAETVDQQWYSLSDLEHSMAVQAGCRRGEFIGAGTCVYGGPCPMSDAHKELPYMSDALLYWCEHRVPQMTFDTNDVVFNKRMTIVRACEFYLRAYFVVVKGYSTIRARAASDMLCGYDAHVRKTKGP